MDHKSYMTVSCGIFAIVALLHLARIVLGWDAVIGGWVIPVWFSWVAFFGAGFMAYSANLHRK